MERLFRASPVLLADQYHPTNATRMEFGTYSFFLVPFFLKFLGFLPAVIGSQMISTRRGIPS
jgi:Mg/Co/Ni transporter MgtE